MNDTIDFFQQSLRIFMEKWKYTRMTVSAINSVKIIIYIHLMSHPVLLEASPAVELAAETMAAVIKPDLLQWGLPPQPASFAVLFSVLSIVLLLCYYSSMSSRRGRGPRPKLPPSPHKLPLIGNLHQLGPLVHRSLRVLSRRHGPLMLLQLGQVPTLVVSSASLAEEVMKTHDLAFASRPRQRFSEALTAGKGMVFSPYGEYWRQARRVCAVHLLSAQRVQEFRSAREEEVALLVGTISKLSTSGGAVDVGYVLSSFTNWVICRAAVGAPAAREEAGGEFAELVAQSIAVSGEFHVDDFFPSLRWLGKLAGKDAKVARLAARWRAALNRRVEEAAGRRDGGGGFLDVLLSLQREATTGFVPSTDEIHAILLGLISAGTDTSSLVLQWALSELVRNPATMKKAQDEVREAVQGKPAVAEDDLTRMTYLKAVMKEALRLHPPAPLLVPRESMKAVQLRGYDIPSKTRVVVNAWAIARDPDYWESPEEFLPERFLKSSVDFRGNDFQFIPFGAGRRICPGMHFATATIELALANLLYHFDWGLPEGAAAENMDMDEAPGLTVGKRRSLRLVPKRISSPHEKSSFPLVTHVTELHNKDQRSDVF